MFKGASAGNFMGKGGQSRIFKGASGDFMGKGGPGRPRRSVRVGFRTTARLPPRRVRVGSRPHVLPGGRAVGCFIKGR